MAEEDKGRLWRSIDTSGSNHTLVKPSELFCRKKKITELRNLSHSHSTKTLMRNFPATRTFKNHLAEVANEQDQDQQKHYLRALKKLTRDA